MTNECGNLDLPLFLDAQWNSIKKTYDILFYEWDINKSKFCKSVGSAPKRKRNI